MITTKQIDDIASAAWAHGQAVQRFANARHTLEVEARAEEEARKHLGALLSEARATAVKAEAEADAEDEAS